MKFNGIIIEESLADKTVLQELNILKTEVEKVTEEHNTPWLTQWTVHTVEVPEVEINSISEKISMSFDPIHSDWYADFKNELFHFIVFPEKIFRIVRTNPDEYAAAVSFGKSLGIAEHQLDFAPDVEQWKRDNNND